MQTDQAETSPGGVSGVGAGKLGGRWTWQRGWRGCFAENKHNFLLFTIMSSKLKGNWGSCHGGSYRSPIPTKRKVVFIFFLNGAQGSTSVSALKGLSASRKVSWGLSLTKGTTDEPFFKINIPSTHLSN